MRQFSNKFFLANRERLAAALPDSYIVVAGHSMLQQSADMAYSFRQDSNFWYLTGIDEPDMVLGIDTFTGESTLFLPTQNDYQSEWDGAFSKEELQQTSGIDKIIFKADLNMILKSGAKKGLKICYVKPLDEIVQPYGFYSNPARRRLESEICEILKCLPEDLRDIRLEIAQLRQVKQQVEIDVIQKAIDITGAALRTAKASLKSHTTERELERAISSEFFAHGSDGHGYDPIIASGKNAAIIHYNKNCCELDSSDIVLLDVGARVDYYSADISRTWSVGDKPSDRQREVYEAVVGLQQKAFKLLGPGVKIREYQKKMEKHAAQAIKKLGVTPGKYPHGFSHFLGLDVHDAGDYDAPLVENSILTVEPGVYLASEGIGVRIEDVVRITKSGVDIMSKNIPKDL